MPIGQTNVFVCCFVLVEICFSGKLSPVNAQVITFVNQKGGVGNLQTELIQISDKNKKQEIST